MFDLFPLIISLWVMFSSCLWLSFMLVFLVFILSLNYISMLNWFSFMIILLWVNGLLILVIYISTSGLSMKSMPSLFLFFMLILMHFENYYKEVLFFSPTLKFLLGFYFFLFFFLLWVCLFLVKIFSGFGLGPFRAS